MHFSGLLVPAYDSALHMKMFFRSAVKLFADGKKRSASGLLGAYSASWGIELDCCICFLRQIVSDRIPLRTETKSRRLPGLERSQRNDWCREETLGIRQGGCRMNRFGNWQRSMIIITLDSCIHSHSIRPAVTNHVTSCGN